MEAAVGWNSMYDGSGGQVNRMRSNGSDRDVQVIQFVHNGRDLRYRIFIPAKYEDTSVHKPGCEIMRIDFDDLEEVMTLIQCLGQFAHEVRNGMGEWRRER